MSVVNSSNAHNPWLALSKIIAIVLFEAQNGYKSVNTVTGEVVAKLKDYELASGFGLAQYEYVFSKSRAEHRRQLASLYHVQFVDTRHGFQYRQIIVSTFPPNVSYVPSTWIVEYEAKKEVPLLQTPVSVDTALPATNSPSPVMVSTTHSTLDTINNSTSVTLQLARSVVPSISGDGNFYSEPFATPVVGADSTPSTSSAFTTAPATTPAVALTIEQRISILSEHAGGTGTLVPALPSHARDQTQRFYSQSIRPTLTTALNSAVTYAESRKSQHMQILELLLSKMLHTLTALPQLDTIGESIDKRIVDSLCAFLPHLYTHGTREKSEQSALRVLLTAVAGANVAKKDLQARLGVKWEKSLGEAMALRAQLDSSAKEATTSSNVAAIGVEGDAHEIAQEGNAVDGGKVDDGESVQGCLTTKSVFREVVSLANRKERVDKIRKRETT